MESITVGQIISTIASIAGAITAIGVIMRTMHKWNEKAFNKAIEPINNKLDEVIKNADNIDMNVCKNYVIEYIGEEKRGVKHTETETRLFWDNYDRYIARGGNSYVKEEVDKLKKEGKI